MARIFVYGTLRTGMYNYDQYLKDKQSFKKYGYIKGKLMSLKGQKYPAFLLEGDDMMLFERLMDLLDDCDDVDQIFHNVSNYDDGEE